MEIRKLLPSDDRRAVSDVYEQSWKAAYRGIVPQSYLDSIPAGRWAPGLDRPDRNNLVMVDGNRIVGTSTYAPSRWEAYPDYGEVISIYLLPEYMGQGHGKLLMDHAIEALRGQGFDRVLLWVLEENVRARRFYEKYGFIPSGERMVQSIGGKELGEVMYTYCAK